MNHMRKSYFLLFLLVVGLHNLKAQLVYCDAGPSTNRGGEISSVRLLGETQNINFEQPCLGVLYVNDQRNKAIADLRPGNGYTLEVTYSVCNGGHNSATTVYIDYNQNGIFESSEVLDSRAPAINPHTQQFLFWVPANTPAGLTTMRILMFQDITTLPLDPCYTDLNGSVADFSVFITDTALCTTPSVSLALADRTSICAGDSVNLSATSVSYGPGIVHQWEVSQNNIVFNNVQGGDQVFFQTGAITANSWYRLRVSCGAQTVYSPPLLITATHAPLPGGIYEINRLLPTGGNTFNSFGDFFSRIQCAGILGPVSVAVASGSGPYNEKALVGPVPGASATNTITINGQGETIQWFERTEILRGVIVLNEARHFNFENLKIKGLNPKTACGIHLSSNSHFNKFTNCEIELPYAQFDPHLTSVIISGKDLMDAPQQNTFVGNRISGGFLGMMVISNNSVDPAIGNVIQNNIFVDFQREAILIFNQKDLILTGNEFKFENHPGPNSSRGVRISGNLDGTQISSNQFFNFGRSNGLTFIGLVEVFNAFASINNPLLVSNNIAFGLDGISHFVGFSLSNNENVKVLNNTIFFDDTVRQNSQITMVSIDGVHQNLEVANNIFHCNQSGTNPIIMLKIDESNATDINHNVYSNGNASRASQFVYQRIIYNGFKDWKTQNRFNWDLFSISDDPGINPSQVPLLLPSSGALDNLGKAFPVLVPVDFRDSARSAFPDPGAFEFQGPLCAVPVQFVADSVQPNAVYLNWSQPGAFTNEWELSYGAEGLTPGQAGSQTLLSNNVGAHVTGLQHGTCYDWYLRALCPGVNPDSSLWIGPLTICLPLAHDLELVRILEPTSQVRCGRDSNQVRVVIANRGALPISGAVLELEMSGVYSTSQRVPIPGFLAPNAVDTFLVHQYQLGQIGPLNVKVKVDWPLDQNQANDSLIIENIEMTAAYPLVVNDWYCLGAPIVSLEVAPIPGAFHRWYRTPQSQTAFHVGDRYGIQVADIEPYYVSYAIGDTGTLSTMGIPTKKTSYGVTFDLKAEKDLYLTKFDVRTLFTSPPTQNNPYRIFITDSTAHNKIEQDWHLVQQGFITPLSSNSGTIELNTPLFIPANKSFGVYLDFETFVTADTQTYNNGILRFSSGKYADLKPFDQFGSGTFNGNIHYVLEGCESERILVQAKPFTDSIMATFDFRYNNFQEVVFDASKSIGSQFFWDFGDGQTGSGPVITHQYDKQGIWEVKLEVSDSICNYRDSAKQNVLNLKSGTESPNIVVVPNPSAGVFDLFLESIFIEDITFQIFDTKGRIVFDGIMNKSSGLYTRTIDLSGLSSGVYIFKTENYLGIKPVRLIKI
jgi:PKD repeat protein